MTGKEKCKYLKALRAAIANAYKIEGFEYKECEFKGECSGTCPACDAEAEALYAKLNSLGHDMDAVALKDVEHSCLNEKLEQPLHYQTKGKVMPRQRRLAGKTIPKEVKGFQMVDGKMSNKTEDEYKQINEDCEKQEIAEDIPKKPRGLRGLFKKKK